MPGTWRDAWEWARICGYLDAIDGREALRGLAQTRIDAEAKLRAAYLRLVEHRTWRKLLEAITPRVGAALNAYLAAVAHMGRGLGVRAIGLRRDARKAMTAAYKATPCWIMPHWRVSESLPPELGIFDLVIIDEASQSDAWALPAIARGQKLLIVGDDKQVSPSDVGWKESEIDRLRHRFLQRLPYPQHFLPGRSIYDLGSTMFAGSLIRLREHFRCVEPIIAFSNREFYANEIKPLRIPSPQERLDPPLIDVYVKGGYRRGTIKINEPEAQAIIDEIERLTQDQRTQGHSIGVVSLLGSEQARYIQDRLFQRLGEETYLRHRIRCGDAMHFQGKECDIVLVSMVSTGEDRAVSGRVFKQRYNVACSRARDRLYLFHSFERTHLNDRDLRARLLDHFAQPLGLELDTDRDPRDLCESDFERSVYDALVQLGYRVTTQVRAGGYRIDLVVDGLDGRRLAIECDGDQYHVGRWMEDMARQRVLERMGWRFWRCWASSWITARDTCLQDLIETLAARGIEPWSGEQSARQSALVEYRIIEPADDGPTASGEIPEAEPGTVAEGIQSTDIPHEADGNDDRDDDSTEQPLSPDDLDPASSTAPRRVDQVTMPQIRDAIVASLSNSPHYSGTRSSMTTRVLKELGIRTRGKPRTAFERRVQRGVADLAKQGVLQEYKSKNLRIRLTRGNAAP